MYCTLDTIWLYITVIVLQESIIGILNAIIMIDVVPRRDRNHYPGCVLTLTGYSLINTRYEQIPHCQLSIILEQFVD